MSRLPMHVSSMVLSAFMLAGCASVATPKAGTEAAEAPMMGNEVSGAELSATGATNLYDALVRTRRQYFVARGVSSGMFTPRDDILVFRGGALMGEATLLKMLRPSDVRFVRRISAVDTYYKYGKSVSVGGLEIELVKE